MDPQDAINLTQQAMLTALLLGAPVLLAGVLVGLLIGLAQALTQIQDQTVAFVPKGTNVPPPPNWEDKVKKANGGAGEHGAPTTMPNNAPTSVPGTPTSAPSSAPPTSTAPGPPTTLR